MLATGSFIFNFYSDVAGAAILRKLVFGSGVVGIWLVGVCRRLGQWKMIKEFGTNYR
jgi:hypothetical protein